MAPPTLPPPDRLSVVPAWGEVGDLIRRFCAVAGRFGFRVGGVDCVGHVFIAGGRVIHAEYGEDYGLDALMQMLRAGPLWIETWAGPWPRQETLHLSADVLLGSTLRPGPSTESIAPADTGVVRKVVLPQPDPLPSFEDEPSPPGVTLSTRLARALSLAPPALHSTPPHSTPPSTLEPLPAEPSPGVLLEALLRSGPPSLLPTAEAIAEVDLDADTGEAEPLTTMVRLTSRGLLLAARGDNVARLADAASLIHGLANLIAVDLGRRRTATVHLRGRTKSMFVTRSEVHDIAAVYGPTQRL
ncbi:MAG: hypothetical protein RL033_7394, partial [Pseudomonadota bacterium]